MYDHCNITIRQYWEVMFVNTSAMQYGGAMYCDHHSDVTLEGYIPGPVTFIGNAAEHGGAICVSQSIMKFANNSVAMLDKNRAIGNGRAIYFSNDFVTLWQHLIRILP